MGHIDQEHLRIWRAQGYREANAWIRAGKPGGGVQCPHPKLSAAKGAWSVGAEQAIHDDLVRARLREKTVVWR